MIMGQQLVVPLSLLFIGEFSLFFYCRKPWSCSCSTVAVRTAVVDFGTGPGSFGCSCLTFPKILQTAGRLIECDLQKKALFFIAYSKQSESSIPLAMTFRDPKIPTVMLHNGTSGIS